MKQVLRLLAGVMLITTAACTQRTINIGGASPGGEVSSAMTTPAAFTKPVSFSVLQDYPKGEDLKEVLKDFQLIKELGLNTWRGSFSWIDYEPQRGKYDYAWLHRFASLAAREGIT